MIEPLIYPDCECRRCLLNEIKRLEESLRIQSGVIAYMAMANNVLLEKRCMYVI